ncbi:hypothetical protein GCM10022286_00460 [Gryllotalpicola daejeonensis]|uniref:Uncharacterized protein n=1 Tax=Gryllotalpicola daejeonensis TaxID=993087 RepID=A0ABP7ZCW1_9MICO
MIAHDRQNLFASLPFAGGNPAEIRELRLLVAEIEVEAVSNALAVQWERLDTEALELPGPLVTQDAQFFKLMLDNRFAVVEHDAFALSPFNQLLPAAFKLHLDSDGDLFDNLDALRDRLAIGSNLVDADKTGETFELVLGTGDFNEFASAPRFGVRVAPEQPDFSTGQLARDLADAVMRVTGSRLDMIRRALPRSVHRHVINVGVGALYVAATSDGDLRSWCFEGVEGGLTDAIRARHELLHAA